MATAGRRGHRRLPRGDGIAGELIALLVSLLALGLLVAAATLAPWMVVLIGPPVLVTGSLLRRAREKTS